MHKGCSDNKCPCRRWFNCKRYNDDKRKEARLKQKGYGSSEWYETYYRIPDSLQDIGANG